MRAWKLVAVIVAQVALLTSASNASTLHFFRSGTGENVHLEVSFLVDGMAEDVVNCFLPPLGVKTISVFDFYMNLRIKNVSINTFDYNDTFERMRRGDKSKTVLNGFVIRPILVLGDRRCDNMARGRLSEILQLESDPCWQRFYMVCLGKHHTFNTEIGAYLSVADAPSFGDGILCGLDGFVGRLKRIANVQDSQKANASGGNTKNRHDPLSIGIVPRIKFAQGGYKIGEILILVMFYAVGVFVSYHVADWLTKPRDKNNHQ